jgi:protein tyrosine/serine phosphatase
MRNRKRLLWLAAAALVIAGVAGGVWFGHYRDKPHHFAVVKPGVLYRTGQPDAKGWEWIMARYPIKTVLDLRPPDEDASAYALEEAFCREHGLELVDMPMSRDGHPPTPEQFAQFLDLVRNPSRQPVLVHCEFGSLRTGVLAAAYRILEEGWSYDRAYSEANGLRFNREKAPEDDAFLRDLEKNRSASAPR